MEELHYFVEDNKVLIGLLCLLVIVFIGCTAYWLPNNRKPKKEKLGKFLVKRFSDIEFVSESQYYMMYKLTIHYDKTIIGPLTKRMSNNIEIFCAKVNDKISFEEINSPLYYFEPELKYKLFLEINKITHKIYMEVDYGNFLFDLSIVNSTAADTKFTIQKFYDNNYEYMPYNFDFYTIKHYMDKNIMITNYDYGSSITPNHEIPVITKEEIQILAAINKKYMVDMFELNNFSIQEIK